jgi:multimeric flavodoxin WrbA
MGTAEHSLFGEVKLRGMKAVAVFDWLKSGKTPSPRKGMPTPRLDEKHFKDRFRAQFADPAFEPLSSELDRIANAAWDAYFHSRKSPYTQNAGASYADPDYKLACDWIAARGAIQAAEARHAQEGTRNVLLINASPRSEHTCPGEMSKSYRLTLIAEDVLSAGGVTTKRLDLSRVTSEYGRQIHPCKACFSTAAALCHWPCSCYPNYSLGQTQDWMNEIYPMWVEAHGIMIITPVHWYQATSPLKLMIDRLVCADGGNPDPTSTHGKNAAEAKAIEIEGWSYPRHLAGRLFSVIVHGDTEGVTAVRRALVDWLISMELESAGGTAELERYIGYWEPYATSHDALDADLALQGEVRVAAQTLAAALRANAAGSRLKNFGIKEPRQK